MKNDNLFSSLKKSAGSNVELVIPIGKPIEAILRPIATEDNFINSNDVQLLTEWRNRFVKSFLTEFVANKERTHTWLTNSVAKDPGKLMFMIDTLEGISIGHIGLGFINWKTGYVEADAIVRGRNTRKGLMKESLKLLLEWASVSLGLHNAWVRVRSDNPAVHFYQKVGFSEKKRVPLANRQQGDTFVWYEDFNAGEDSPSLVYMQYKS